MCLLIFQMSVESNKSALQWHSSVYVLCLQYVFWPWEVKGGSKAGLSQENGEVEEDVNFWLVLYWTVIPGSGTTDEAGGNKEMGWEMVEFPSLIKSPPVTSSEDKISDD